MESDRDRNTQTHRNTQRQQTLGRRIKKMTDNSKMQTPRDAYTHEHVQTKTDRDRDGQRQTETHSFSDSWGHKETYSESWSRIETGTHRHTQTLFKTDR